MESRPRNGLTVARPRAGTAHPAARERAVAYARAGRASRRACRLRSRAARPRAMVAQPPRTRRRRRRRAPRRSATWGSRRRRTARPHRRFPRQNRVTAAAAAASPPKAPPPQLDRKQYRRTDQADHELASLALHRLGDTVGERCDDGGLVCHAANGTPSTAAAMAEASNSSRAALRWTPGTRHDEHLVSVLGRQRRHRMPPWRSPAASTRALHPPARKEAVRRDAAARDEERPRRFGTMAGASTQASKPRASSSSRASTTY